LVRKRVRYHYADKEAAIGNLLLFFSFLPFRRNTNSNIVVGCRRCAAVSRFVALGAMLLDLFSLGRLRVRSIPGCVGLLMLSRTPQLIIQQVCEVAPLVA
jgi:hypothetical protein